MRKGIWYILIGILVLIVALTILAIFNEVKWSSEEEMCKRGDGVWREFPDSCADMCFYQRGGDRYCAQVITLSCECSAGECWNGKSCVPI